MTRITRSVGLLSLFLGLAGCASAGSIVADYTTLSPMNVATILVGGTTVTGSANVTADLNPGIGSTGLGIAGGGSDASLDLGETLTINYGQLVKNVTLTVYDIDPPGNVTYRFQAFNGSTSLGLFSIPSHTVLRETKDLSALAGGIFFSRITLSETVSAPLGLIIERTSFDFAVPEPPASILFASGILPLLCVIGYRLKARRAACA